jgi:hypothetical protein
MRSSGVTDVDSEAEHRLAAHVQRILDAGAVPWSERADLAEEIAGHLHERIRALRDDGLNEDTALERAISDFGGVATIGDDLRRTYHSRLWVSTIGILLPVAAYSGDMPGVVRWVARGGNLFAMLSLFFAAFAALTMSPVRAVAVGGALGIGAVAIWLAAEALRRGQAWGWTVMTWVLAVEGVTFFVALWSPSGNVNVSITGLIGLLLLVRLLANGTTLRGWVGQSGSLPRKVGVGLAAVMIAWGVVPFASPLLPDPTQASEADVSVLASVACGHNYNSDLPVKTVTVVLDITWARIDLLPLGLVKATQDWGDSIRLDLTDAWATGGPSLTDAATGAGLDQNGAYGLTMPTSLLLSRTDAGVDASVMHPGRTVRLTLIAYPTDRDTAEYPSQVEIRYAHLDRFVLATYLACGGHGRLIPERDLMAASSWNLLTGSPIEP